MGRRGGGLRGGWGSGWVESGGWDRVLECVIGGGVGSSRMRGPAGPAGRADWPGPGPGPGPHVGHTRPGHPLARGAERARPSSAGCARAGCGRAGCARAHAGCARAGVWVRVCGLRTRGVHLRAG